MNKNTDTADAKCYYCGATDQPMVYTKVHGWKCRSARACTVREMGRDPWAEKMARYAAEQKPVPMEVGK